MSSMKKLLVTGCVSAAVMAAIGSMSVMAEDGEYVIGAAMYDLTNTFYVNMMNGGDEAAEDYGAQVIWKSSEGSLDNEISIIENFIQQGVDCIMIDPIDAEGVKSVINEAGEIL